MIALVVGATGFTGRKLCQRLLEDDSFTKVYVLLRRKKNVSSPKLVQQVIDFDQISQKDIPDHINVAFCCLGTTIKKAKTKENFRKVDYEYITKFAKLCDSRGIEDFHLISSIGANPNSIFYYQKVKGEVESFITSLNFKSVVIYRPSVIYGGRKEFRLFESFAAWFSRNFKFLFIGKLNRILAITGDQLAKCIHLRLKKSTPGRCVIESEEIYSIK